MASALDSLLAQFRDAVQFHLDGLHGGQLSPTDFQIGVAQDLLVFHTAAYLDGLEGEVRDLDEKARKLITGVVSGQVEYLNAFVDAIEAGDLSDDQIDARAMSYGGGMQQSYWRGATDGEDLPAYPGDGSSECLGNCGCEWDVRDGGAYWVRGKDDSCATCLQREQDWAPYTGGD